MKELALVTDQRGDKELIDSMSDKKNDVLVTQIGKSGELTFFSGAGKKEPEFPLEHKDSKVTEQHPKKKSHKGRWRCEIVMEKRSELEK